MTRPLDRAELARQLRALGLEAGDRVLVHSSLSSLGHVEGGADALIDALLDVVTASGTLVVRGHAMVEDP